MARFGKAKQREDYEVNSNPGPIYWIRELSGKDAKKISFTKGKRPELHSGAHDSPLAKYSPKPPDNITPEIRFGSAARFQEDLHRRIDPVGTPGPLDTSNVSAFQFKSDTPTYSFQGRPTKDVARYLGKYLSSSLAEAPPPGSYTTDRAEQLLSKTKRIKDVTFGREKRSGTKTTSKPTPGPDYETHRADPLLSKNSRYPTAHFGTSTRPPLYNLYASEYPGPGASNPNYKLVYKKDTTPAAWSKSKTPKDPSKSNLKRPSGPTLGPGQYNWDKLAPRVRNTHISGKWKERKPVIDGPDMTKYSKRSSVGAETPKYTFSREGTSESTENLSKPNIKLSGRGYKRMYQGKALQSQEPDPDIPAVGAYNPRYDSLTLSNNRRVPGFSFGAPRTRPRSSSSARSTTSSRRSSIGSAKSSRPGTSLGRKRSKTPNGDSSPAPGDYDIVPGLRSLSQSKRVRGGRWHRQNGFDKSIPRPGLDSPGPKYNPKRDRYFETLVNNTKGTRFGGLQ